MTDNLDASIEELERLKESLSKENQIIEPHEKEAVNAYAGEGKHNYRNGAYLRISDDKMKAWIYLNPPGEGERHYSKSDIMEMIYEHGILKGIHNSNVAAIAKKHIYEREILVVQGLAPVDGIDGYYEWNVEVNKRREPVIREDGTVDYSSMAAVPTIDEGQVIAVYHPPVAAKHGYDIFGKRLVAKPARELPKLHGRGVSNEADPNVYIATVSGRIECDGSLVDIKNCHQINGDVDLIIGKIEFYGDVEIMGNVENGVIIRASRNVSITGTVSGATIYAGGDVVINKGVTGGQKAKINAKGSVYSEFIEHCNVDAGCDVRSNSFINSVVTASGRVMAEGRNGSIMGGSVRGLLGVSATSVSNESETKTTVAAGYSAEEYSRYLILHDKETELQKNLSDVVEQMSQILKEKRLNRIEDSEETENMLAELSEKKDSFFDALDKTRAEKDALAYLIERGKGSMISVEGKLYRGTTICIEGTNYVLPKGDSFMKYRNEGGRINGTVIVM